MFGISADDVVKVYEQLKDRYDLVLTTAFALKEGYTENFPVLAGKAHGHLLRLYEYGGDFVLAVTDAKHTKGIHWHPNDVEAAVEDIVEFMDVKTKYKMQRFKRL